MRIKRCTLLGISTIIKIRTSLWFIWLIGWSCLPYKSMGIKLSTLSTSIRLPYFKETGDCRIRRSSRNHWLFPLRGLLLALSWKIISWLDLPPLCVLSFLLIKHHLFECFHLSFRTIIIKPLLRWLICQWLPISSRVIRVFVASLARVISFSLLHTPLIAIHVIFFIFGFQMWLLLLPLRSHLQTRVKFREIDLIL